MADAPVIDVRGLRKHYGPVEALRGVSFEVPAGSICGLLGPNAAGKTTLLKLLMGMVRPTEGRATVFGLPCHQPDTSVEIRRRLAYVSENKDLLDSMTVDGIIRFTAGFFPAWDAALEQRYRSVFQLPGRTRVTTLSRGHRTKLALLLAFCRNADVLVLDEPTAGLDPASAEEVLQMIVSQAAARGVTVLFSSHQIAEVEQIADRLVIVARGLSRVEGALDDVLDRYCRVQFVFDGEAPAALPNAPAIERIDRDGRVMTVLGSGGRDAIVAEGRRLGAISTTVTPVTLKELFLAAVGGRD